jgi:flagellar motility protein MotE (MotC chaperone)
MSMMRYIRDLRLIPIALIASACLLVLKVADLALDGSRWFASNNAPASDDATSVVHVVPDATDGTGEKKSWAHEMFNFPDGSGASAAPKSDMAVTPAEQAMADRDAQAADADITGSITPAQAAEPAKDAAKPAPAPSAAKAKPAPPAQDGTVIPLTADGNLPSVAEREILQRLQQRREELDQRSRELDIRESMVKAAEQRINAHLTEIKDVESRIKTETVQKDQAEANQFKGLVTMYEAMKARDAAKIFDGLDMDVLIKVASAINPRTMADIMAQMTPDIAEKLTVALASKAQQQTAKNDPGELPKIEGQPTAP